MLFRQGYRMTDKFKKEGSKMERDARNEAYWTYINWSVFEGKTIRTSIFPPRSSAIGLQRIQCKLLSTLTSKASQICLKASAALCSL